MTMSALAAALGLPDDATEEACLDRARELRVQAQRAERDRATEPARFGMRQRAGRRVVVALVGEMLKDQRLLARTQGYAESSVSVLERLRLRIEDAYRTSIEGGAEELTDVSVELEPVEREPALGSPRPDGE